MVAVQQTRVHPETGATLVRGVRTVMLTFRSQKETIEMPGWYPTDDPTADQGIHDARDTQVADRAINAMKAREAGLLTPGQIRAARKKLGLTQRDAGRIIGGGPNAFQKYEAGDVVVSKAADTALRLLSNKPERLRELLGEAHMA
jgi:HTH-type transcriptional regulator / antitoxin MqsA